MRISDWSSDVCSSDLAEMVEGTRSNGILVPQGAVSRDEKGSATVLVVGAQNKIEMRKLNAPRTVGTNWLVTAGLKPGDKVVVDGAQMLRPGVVVKAVPARSEEHTSELQSLMRISYAVFCLKKKKKNKHTATVY